MAQYEGGKKKSGNRKHGRSKTKCDKYLKEGRREINKARRAAKLKRRYARKSA